jgi:hypothetical protein
MPNNSASTLQRTQLAAINTNSLLVLHKEIFDMYCKEMKKYKFTIWQNAEFLFLEKVVLIFTIGL